MIDMVASAPQYQAHLQPIWDALPEELRGECIGRGPSPARLPSPRAAACMVAAHLDLVRARGLGYRRFAYVEHGIGQSYANGNPAYPGGRDRGDVALFLSPNATAAAADRAVYPQARIVEIGDARLDTLPAREPGPPLVCISTHWDCHVAPETKSAFRYYHAAIAALAKQLPLIGHCHPRARGWVEPLLRRVGVEFVESFDAVCRRADVYVCDNSSSMYEFAATGRNVVVLNAPWYRRDFHPGLRFWAAAGVGPQVDTPEALADAVHTARSQSAAVSGAREAALDVAYAYRSGAPQRAADAVQEWLT